MDISLSIFFFSPQQEYNFPSQSVSNLILAWKSQWRRCYEHLYNSGSHLKKKEKNCVICYSLCFVLYVDVLWSCDTARADCQSDRTLLRFCSMSKMFFCTLSAFSCSFSIRVPSAEDWLLKSKHTPTGQAAVCFVHKLSLFPSVKSLCSPTKPFSWVLWVFKAHMQTEAYLESDVPETKAQGILNFRIWYKINICKEKYHLIYNYRIFQCNLIFNVFIINETDRQTKKHNPYFALSIPTCLFLSDQHGGFLYRAFGKSLQVFVHTWVQVFSQRSQYPALQRWSEPKATHCIKPQAPEL